MTSLHRIRQSMRVAHTADEFDVLKALCAIYAPNPAVRTQIGQRAQGLIRDIRKSGPTGSDGGLSGGIRAIHR